MTMQSESSGGSQFGESSTEDQRARVVRPAVLSIILWLGALVTVLFYGAFVSAVAWTLAGLMAWSPIFRDMRAKGKQTLSSGGRVAVGTILAVLGLAFHPAWSPVPSSTTAVRLDEQEPTKIDLKPDPTQVATWLAMEKRNRAKIDSLLADLNALDKEDYEGQLNFWKEITALAPGNADYAQAQSRVQIEIDEIAPLLELPSQGLEVTKAVGRKGGFGSVLLIDVTVRNRSRSNLKDFQIDCALKGNSGTEIGTVSTTLYEMVPARTSRTFSNVNMGLMNPQTARFNCTIGTAAIG